MLFRPFPYSGNILADIADRIREAETDEEELEAEESLELYESSLENER